MDLLPHPYFQLFVAGQLDLRSNERSNSNFDCRNGFLGVDYIGLDTLHGKIEHFTQIARGGSPPHMGGSDPHFFSRNQNGFTNDMVVSE